MVFIVLVLLAVGAGAYLALHNVGILFSQRNRTDDDARYTAREWHDHLWEDVDEAAAEAGQREWLADDDDQAVTAHGGPAVMTGPIAEQAAPGSPVQGARIHEAACPSCGDAALSDGGRWACPACRAAGVIEDAAVIVKRAARR